MNIRVHPRPSVANSRALLALAIGFALATCGKSSDQQPQTLQLQVISPHGSDIRREFAAAFSNWHQQHFGQPVEILYPDIGGGGTGNIVRQLDAAYAHSNTSTYDVMFGGGSVAFSTFLSKNYLAPLPPLSPDEMQKAHWPIDPLAQVPNEIFHSPLRSGTGTTTLWIAATMSNFGIEINPDRIHELHQLDPRLTTPSTWADLAGPQWFGQLSLADPSKSGSVKTSYEMILQQYGWEKGWPTLVLLFANAALIRESGSYPADDAASAEALAGIVIDFYGRLQVSRVGPRAAAFIIPAGGTALDADPIALLKGAPHPALAARFIRFVISPEGQRLWIDKPGTPGGPLKSALGRMSVLPDLYQSEGPNLFDPRNPFTSTNMLQLDSAAAAQRNAFLGDLIKAALIDNHEALVRARRTIKNAGDPPNLLAQLTALPTFLPTTPSLNPNPNPNPNLNPNPTPQTQLNINTLTFDSPQPLTAPTLQTFAQEYSPPKGDPREPYAERLQTTLKDHWRDSFAARFAELARTK